MNLLARHLDDLRWLYMELYNNDALFAELFGNLHRFAEERPIPLKKRNLEREPESNDLTGIMLYIDNFAGSLNGARKSFPILGRPEQMLHLMRIALESCLQP